MSDLGTKLLRYKFTQIAGEVTADFETTPSSGIAPLQVIFTNKSTGDNLSYLWDFGDGSLQITEKNTIHTYNTPGIYIASLYISNGIFTDSYSLQIIVNEAQINPLAPPTSTISAGSTVYYTKLVCIKSISQQTNISYLWNFGDGQTSTEQNPCHLYSDYGNYTVTLTTISNETNLSSVVSMEIYVVDVNKLYDYVSIKAPSIETNNGIYYSLYATSYNNDPNSVLIDGASLDVKEEISAKLLIYNITDFLPPIFDVYISPLSAFASADIHFNVYPKASNYTYLWDFGDGTTSTEQNPVHIYTNPDRYNITLTVSNNKGSVKYTQTIFILKEMFSVFGSEFYYLLDTAYNYVYIFKISDNSLFKKFGGSGSSIGHFINPTSLDIIRVNRNVRIK